jgi:hypothetical protein
MTPRECILASFALASSGHLVEARDSLRRNPPCLDTVEGLDLLARIELRLGNEVEARRLWTSAASMGDDRARRALSMLDTLEWRHRRLIRALRVGVPIALLLLAGFLLGRGCVP